MTATDLQRNSGELLDEDEDFGEKGVRKWLLAIITAWEYEEKTVK